MPIYDFPSEPIVIDAARAIGAASVPAYFIPGADSTLLITTWTGMLVRIAADYNEITEEQIKSLVGSLATAIVTYKTGSTVLSIVAGVVLTTMSGGLALLLGTSTMVLANAVLNAYYTYELGKAFDEYFSNHRRFDLTELLNFLMRIVIPNVSSIQSFWHNCGLSFSEIMHWLRR